MPWVIIFALALVAALVLWVWLVNDDDSAGPERGVTVEQIAESDAFDDDGFAGDLIGQQVTVSGNVSEIVGTNAIRLGGDDFGGDGILVIQVSGAGSTVTEDEAVRVTGTVRDFDAAAFEREFGTDIYDDGIYDAWLDENILVASSVTGLNTADDDN
jgi:hypothetical protein